MQTVALIFVVEPKHLLAVHKEVFLPICMDYLCSIKQFRGPLAAMHYSYGEQPSEHDIILHFWQYTHLLNSFFPSADNETALPLTKPAVHMVPAGQGGH